ARETVGMDPFSHEPPHGAELDRWGARAKRDRFRGLLWCELTWVCSPVETTATPTPAPCGRSRAVPSPRTGPSPPVRTPPTLRGIADRTSGIRHPASGRADVSGAESGCGEPNRGQRMRRVTFGGEAKGPVPMRAAAVGGPPVRGENGDHGRVGAQSRAVAASSSDAALAC